ncbi:MAG: Cache, type 2 domain protein [candidate division TM6 bacterium GW2011_GWE2_41_16]|nr:MAG: Cache, type 2 domain protein [candidate division TM6 bacterium GW2011_GWE2_41_16]
MKQFFTYAIALLLMVYIPGFAADKPAKASALTKIAALKNQPIQEEENSEATIIEDEDKDTQAEDDSTQTAVDTEAPANLEKESKETGITIRTISNEQINEILKAKMVQMEKMVNNAVAFLKKHTLSYTCKSFGSDQQWNLGGISLFVFSDSGICYRYDNDSWAIWKNFVKKGEEGEPFIERMREAGEKGLWISNTWKNALAYSYVKTTKKDKQTYIIGASFYPETGEFIAEQLVKAAINLAQQKSARAAFEQISNPMGAFVRGDIYLWAYNMLGECKAHGNNPAMIGQDLLNWQDSNGQYRNKEMIKLVKDAGKGWIEYIENGAIKRAYVEKMEDPISKESFIFGAGYYPFINHEQVQAFVHKAVAHIRSAGFTNALRDFTTRDAGFIEGPLTVFAYRPDGVMLADGQNPIFIGQNLINSKDADGNFITKKIIDIAVTQKSGWFGFVNRRAYADAFVQLVETPEGELIVGSSFWPISKERSVEALAKKAESFFKNHPIDESFTRFSEMPSDFIHGDLFVSVYSEDGICLISGVNKDLIWTDVKTVKNKRGKALFDDMRVVSRGGGWVDYQDASGFTRTYVKRVTRGISETSNKLNGREKSKKTSTAEQSYIIAVSYRM